VFVLDTNILSELIRKKPNSHLLKRLSECPAENLFSTCINVMELRYGSAMRRDSKEFWRKIEEEINSRLTILGFDERGAALCGDLLADLEKQGRPMGIEDAIIGSIALSHGFILVTGNVSHFSRIPSLKVKNWLVP